MWFFDEVRRLPAALLQAVTSARPRRRWVTDGRAHVELRCLDAGEWDAFGPRLERELERLEGVVGAEVNAFVQRVLVRFEPDAITADEIETTITQVEAACGLDARGFAEGRGHPADREALDQELIAVAAAALGVTFGLVGRVTSFAPPSVRSEIGALGALVQEAPPLRVFLEARYRAPVVDLGLSLVGAVTSGIASGPVAPLVDVAHRVARLAEQRSRQEAWARREAELFDVPGRTPSFSPVPGRPVPVPAGPAQRYVERAFRGGVAASGLSLLLGRSGDRAAAAIIATLPRAARLGPDAFAAQLGRVLAERDVIVLDPDALRLLDRVDVFVLEGEVLASMSTKVSAVRVVGDVTVAEARRRAAVLFHPDRERSVSGRGDWELRRAEPADACHPQFRDAVATAGAAGAVSALVHRGERVAFVVTTPSLAPGAAEVLGVALRAGLHVVVVAGPELAPLFTDAEVVGPDGALELVRALQRDGRVVAAVGAAHHDVLVAADCSLGLTRTATVPWGAGMVARDSLADAYLLVATAAAARKASEQSATIALVGAGAALFLAFGGLVPGSLRRASTVVNVAAAVAIVNSTRLALDLGNRPLPAEDRYDLWHALEPDTVLDRLGTSQEGLSTLEAQARLRPLPSKDPAALVFARAVAEEVSSPLTPVLAAGAALSVLGGSFGDALLIFGVMGVDALIGGVQRFRTDGAIARLGEVERGAVSVRRDREMKVLDPSELVLGDIVQLRAGDVVPADLRVLGGSHLEVDEATLTGESAPVRKGREPVLATEVAERASMIYEGTSVAAGDPIGAVVAVAPDTEARRTLLFGGDTPATGVEARLRAITAFMVPVSVASGIGVVAVGFLRQRPLRDTLGAAVSLAVAAVPEGLPLLANVAQLGAARRLSRRGALVRNPRAVEALGRVDVVCADKTGTLTVGAMRVQVVSDLQREGGVDALSGRQREVLAQALRAGPMMDASRGLAHPTDRAIVEAARIAQAAEGDGARGWARRHELPFGPARGYHATSGDDGAPGGRLRLCVKGAPESLLPRCVRRATSDGPRELDDGARLAVQQQVDDLARRGLRVLAIAEGSVADERLHDRHVRDLTLVGFVGLSDPARPTAAAAIAELRRAGIAVVMITGDHPSTAEGVAVELDLLDEGTVMTGPQLDGLSDADLDAVLDDVRVFARVTPAHKVRIVSAFQRAGRTVAMTGDGANDAPAIRLADVGIALGEKSTPAAREAADVVVTDERIETIVDAVVEGRAMWGSVREAVAVLVGGNAGELGFTLLVTVVTGSSPLNARQLLLVNLLTDGLPAMVIALRRPRSFSPEQLIAEGPEASLARPLTRAIAIRGSATAAGATVAYALARVTGTAGRASTVSLVALVGTQLAQTLAIGGRDPLVAATVIGSGLVLAGLVQTPVVSQMFGCRPVGPFGWMIATGAAAGATLGAVGAPKALEVASRIVDSRR